MRHAEVEEVDVEALERFAVAERELKELEDATVAMIAEAERRFLRVSVSASRPMGVSSRLDRIRDWLDENSGAADGC